MTTYRTVPIDGLDIFVREAGPADAQTLVLLPGFPSSSAQYKPLMDRLADRLHVVSLDYPGFGFSSTPPTSEFTYTFDVLAQFTEQLLLGELRLDRFWLYVFDFGAPIGMRIAERHPDRIAGLVVQNGNAYEAGLGPMMDVQKAFWANRAHNEADIRNLLTLEVTRGQYLTGAGDPSRIDPGAPLLDQRLMDEPNRKDAFVELLYDYQSNTARYPHWQRYLRDTQPPTLIVWGKNDQFFTADGAHAYLADLPDARLRLLESGHFALAEHTDVIAEEIRAFIGTRATAPK